MMIQKDIRFIIQLLYLHTRWDPSVSNEDQIAMWERSVKHPGDVLVSIKHLDVMQH